MNELEYQTALADKMAEFRHDPLGYACYMFPWGEAELEKSKGLRAWQAEVLDCIGRDFRAGKRLVRIAVASGHDVGKTAATGIIQKWALDTLPGTKILATANTGAQLKTKTWAELSKWNRLSMTDSWWELTATSMYSKQEKYKLEWRSDMAIWRENRTEAFAGFHNYGKRIVVIIDEASGIPKSIWETIESFLLDEDTEIIVIAFGNPLRKSGGFYEIFQNEAKRKVEGKPLMWHTYNIDSSTIEGINKEHIQDLIDTYGWDSDYVKSRIRGLFPDTSDSQFFPEYLVFDARKRTPQPIITQPLVCGWDVASGGSDKIVFYFRRGLDGKSTPPVIIRGEDIHDATVLASRAAEIFDKYKPDYIFADAGGLGAPIIDMVNQMGHGIIKIHFGGIPSDKEKYYNKTAEMADKAKKWLIDGGSIWDDSVLQEQVCNRLYGTTIKGQLKMESKEDMGKRGLESPDISDAWYLTFAVPVANVMVGGKGRQPKMVTTLDEYKCLTKKK